MDQKAPRETVKMRFTGTLTNGEKRVDIPIPFTSKSMQEGYLTFKQEPGNGNKRPAGVAEVPLHWAAMLLDMGKDHPTFYELVDKMTPELKADLKAAKELYLEQQADFKAKEKALMEA